MIPDCPYCNEELTPIADGATEWRCHNCERWVDSFEIERAARGACPWCGRPNPGANNG